MRRLLLATVAVLTVSLGVGGGALAGSGKGDDGPRTLRLLDVADKFEFVDVGRPAQNENDVSAGDQFVFENNLRNRANTETVGRFVSICTALVSPGQVLCRGTLLLPRGTIALAAYVDFAQEGTIFAAVTGGTKAYRTARGQAKLGEQDAQGTRSLTVELRP